MIVIDASALLEALLRTPDARAVDRWLFEPGQRLHAPHLIDVEVAQATRRLTLSGEVNDARGRGVLTNLADLAIDRHSHGPLLPRAWQLRDNFSAYDAVYVALAELIDAPLLTRDRRLASAASKYVNIKLA
jgi:predicted nucleic acid-binding protein